MHEMSLATAIHASCRSAVTSRGGGRLDSVRIAVGELSAVEPDLLRFAWDAVIAGTADSGAALEVEWRAARQVCPRCGVVHERAAGGWLRLCPRCEGPLRVEGGDELDVLELRYTPHGAPPEELPS